MSQLYTPFRYDFVGSFLRPEYLKKARADYEAGAMSAEELKKTEDKAITELVAKQKEAGYHVITDGEFRRATSWARCSPSPARPRWPASSWAPGAPSS